MVNKKIVFASIISLVSGYVIHDLAHDSLLKLIDRTPFIPKGSSENQKILGKSSSDSFVTTIVYNGVSFSPQYVTLKKGNYLSVINKSTNLLMWLTSDYNGLSTNRGYAEGEQILLPLNVSGSYILKEKVNSSAVVHITVEP
jgi:hypothetical protein